MSSTYPYKPSTPYLNDKNVDFSHQQWCRSVYKNPTKAQAKILQWLLDTPVSEQRKYVILDDTLVLCPTQLEKYALIDGKWRNTTQKQSKKSQKA